MVEKKVIVVVGATGAQGGGLARAILKDSQSSFSVRALTRNINSEKARTLADLGASIVKADLNDKGSLEKVFSGAYGAYCVTNYWEYLSPEKELAQAEAMANAAKKAGLAHVIWSTLEDTRRFVPLSDNRMPTLMGKYKTPHFDAKGEANHFFSDPGLPVTFLHTSFYWDNFIHFGMGPKKQPDGTYAISFCIGDKKMAGMAAEDIGKCAYGIFKKGGQYIRKYVGIAGGILTGAEMAASMSKALGREIRYIPIEPEAYRALGHPGADDLGNMFQFYRDFEKQFTGFRSIQESRSLNPDLLSFEDWLSKYAKQIPLDLASAA